MTKRTPIGDLKVNDIVRAELGESRLVGRVTSTQQSQFMDAPTVNVNPAGEVRSFLLDGTWDFTVIIGARP